MGHRGQLAAVPIAQLIQEYYAGASGRELGTRYAVSHSAIYQRLWNAGIIPHAHIHRGITGSGRYQAPPKPPSLPRRMRAPRKVSDADLLASYAELGSVKAVAEHYGIAYSNAHRHLSALGVVKGYGYRVRRKH